MSLPASVETNGLLRFDRGGLRSDVADAMGQIAAIDWTSVTAELATREGKLAVCERLEDAANLLLDVCDMISRRTSKVE